MFALSCERREEVVELVRSALASGDRRVMDVVDHGVMYSESFYDLDRHHWEAVGMEPKASRVEVTKRERTRAFGSCGGRACSNVGFIRSH
jgi:hypothetical protein